MLHPLRERKRSGNEKERAGRRREDEKGKRAGLCNPLIASVTKVGFNFRDPRDLVKPPLAFLLNHVPSAHFCVSLDWKGVNSFHDRNPELDIRLGATSATYHNSPSLRHSLGHCNVISPRERQHCDIHEVLW